VRDLAALPGLDWNGFKAGLLPPRAEEALTRLTQENSETRRTIDGLRQRQSVLRDSTDNSETTMNRLLKLQRFSLRNGVKPSQAEQQALAESEQLFLPNQQQYEQINEEFAMLLDQSRAREDRQIALQRESQATLRPVQDACGARMARHRLKVAALKLLLLLPLLAGAVYLFIRKRGGLYTPLVYAFGLAVLAKTLVVMHEHFPRKYFKYVLILAAIALVTRTLVYLLRRVAHPRAEWLLCQYRGPMNGSSAPSAPTPPPRAAQVHRLDPADRPSVRADSRKRRRPGNALYLPQLRHAAIRQMHQLPPDTARAAFPLHRLRRRGPRRRAGSRDVLSRGRCPSGVRVAARSADART
jgi:hypothetical protein